MDAFDLLRTEFGVLIIFMLSTCVHGVFTLITKEIHHD